MSDPKPPLEAYALWLMAKGAEHDGLQYLIDELAHQLGTKRFRAHATLIGLPDCPHDKATAVIAAAESIAQKHKPFSLELTGVGVRDAHLQSVFLNAVTTDAFVEANRDAQNTLGKTPAPFLHGSLIYGDLDTATKADARTFVHDRIHFPHVITITHVAAVKAYGYPDEWEILESFPLGG